jgi:hypothetical protein
MVKDPMVPRVHKVLPEDVTTFSTHRISGIRHDFHLHPLALVSALAELAHELFPAKLCRFIAPGSAQESVFHHEATSFNGRDIDEVFRRIEEPGSWIALYNVETVPRYRAFLQEIMETVRPVVEAEQSEVIETTGFIFISAPPSVTPYHIDRENNFWLQLKGQKTITVWDRTDPTVLPPLDADEFIVYRSLERVRLTDELASLGREFERGPGQGVYFPSTTPHMTQTSTDWVKPGNGISISLGVAFYTRLTRRHAQVHQVNLILRRAGMNPKPPGQWAWLDIAKACLGRLIIAVQMRRRGYVPPPGAL